MSDPWRRDWRLWLVGLGVVALLGVVLRPWERSRVPPQLAHLEVRILGAPNEPGAHNLCVFAVYSADGVALPAFERPWCDSVYQRIVIAGDRRVSSAAQAQADSLCFQFQSPLAGLAFQNPVCTGRRPEHIWHITLHLTDPAR